MFHPFGFMSTPAAGGVGTNPITSGLVFGLEMGLGQSYSGTGTVFTDTSPSPLPNGAFVTPTDFNYNSSRYLKFNASSGSNLRFPGATKLSYSETWSFFIYWKPTTGSATYIFDKSISGIDQNSLVYNFDAGKMRPWNSGYRGMTPIPSPLNTLKSIAFTKDLNALSNNYKAYENGSNTFTTTSSFNVSGGTTGVNFNANGPRDNELYNYYVYNRALTPAEVTTIHNYVTSY
tara:strand:+ start:339 stop:1034 length:696 start_codon:yes stop_codon:yes gene_type:complete